MYFTLHARVLIHFRNFLNVPYSLLAKRYYICNVKWQISVTSHHGKRSLTPISTRHFFGTSLIFSNPADNFKVRHLGVLPSRVLRITLAYTFTGVPYTDSFLPLPCILFRAHWAQLWHYSYTSFFIQLALPNLRVLCMRSKNTFLAVPTCYIGL